MGVKVREIPKGSDKFWVIIHHQGRRKKKYCGTGKQGKKVAQQAAEKISALLKLPDADLKKLYHDKERIITLSDYAKKLLVIIKKTREIATDHSHRMNLDNHILPVLGNKPLDEITRQMAKDFILSKLDDKKLTSKYKKDDGKTLTTATVHNIMRTARYVMNCAKEDEIIQTNPFEGLGKLLSLRKTKDNIHPLNEKEVPLYLSIVKKHYPERYPFFLTAIRAGLRKGELICLKWEDLDFVNRFMWVRKTLRRDGTVKDTTKTGKTRRVDMSIELTEVLKALKFERDQQNKPME
jgi:integrase